MKMKPNLDSLYILLFRFDIDYSNDEEQEEFIVSKNVNDSKELSELFDEILKKYFMSCIDVEQQYYIDTIKYYLSKDESFDLVFDQLTLLFDDDVEDHRQFMRVLLECLKHYKQEAEQSE